MPFVRIQAKAGRTADQKKKLADSIVKTMVEQEFASKEAIHVIFEDMNDGDYHQGSKVEIKDQ